MANRRMLHRTYSFSKEFNGLNDFEKVVYMLAIPHLDDFGRIDGDPNVFKAMVLPMNAGTEEVFDAALEKVKEVGLISRYDVNGQKVIQYLRFEDEQTGLNKRTRSRYSDAPPQVFKEYPESLRNLEGFSEVQGNSPLTEPNQTKPNRTEKNITKPKMYGNSYKSYKGEKFKQYPTAIYQPKGLQETRAWEIAKDVGNEYMDYYLQIIKMEKYLALENAYGEFKEAREKGNIEKPEAYMAKIIARMMVQGSS